MTDHVPAMIANDSRPKVFVDLSPLAVDGSNGGAAPFVLGLLRLLAPRLDFQLLVKPGREGAVADVAAAGAVVRTLGGEAADIAEPRRLRRLRRRVPLLSALPDRASLRRFGASALFSPLQSTAFHEPGLRHVAIAYDFQELSHPEFFREEERRRRTAFRADLRRCDLVVAISRFTRDEAVAEGGVPPGRLEVIPPVVTWRERVPAAEAAETLARHGLSSGGYALHPANFWPHKNQGRLLAALALVPGARLVLAGALEEGRRRAAERAAALGVLERVTILPFLPERELTALLQSARLLVYPSLFEGFGIPVLEAFHLGVPVACSEIPALRELAGDAALLFGPSDPRAIAEALGRLWTGQPDRERLVAAGRGCAARFAPERFLSRWEEILST